ncbi:MAG: glycosyltransferase [Candidatus Bipolaricaulaceae bacterium]
MELSGLERYVSVAGEKAIAEIFRLARPIYGLRVLEISSTFHGGGVAGMLHSLIPLLNDVGINADWSLLYAEPTLFQVTKKIHNGLQGEPVDLNEKEMKIYLDVNELFARYSPISHHDLLLVHDPQPLPLIRFRPKEVPWIWRCHIDLSSPHPPMWGRLKPFLLRYDAVVISSANFAKADLPLEIHVIPPALDPFSELNRELPPETVEKKLGEYEIPTDKPLLVQVSRFDKWKDPLGVLRVYELVREKVECRLVLIGNMASDDPEGPEIFAQVQEAARALPDVHLITATDALLVNALQRTAAVVLQLSRREGFGLTVSEALWKGTPVVATRVGGIPLQVIHSETGFLVEPQDYPAAAQAVLLLLKDQELRTRLGIQAREHVRRNFLITRLLQDRLRLFRAVLEKG